MSDVAHPVLTCPISSLNIFGNLCVTIDSPYGPAVWLSNTIEIDPRW